MKKVYIKMDRLLNDYNLSILNAMNDYLRVGAGLFGSFYVYENEKRKPFKVSGKNGLINIGCFTQAQITCDEKPFISLEFQTEIVERLQLLKKAISDECGFESFKMLCCTGEEDNISSDGKKITPGYRNELHSGKSHNHQIQFHRRLSYNKTNDVHTAYCSLPLSERGNLTEFQGEQNYGR